jgi:hypothetical protein
MAWPCHIHRRPQWQRRCDVSPGELSHLKRALGVAFPIGLDHTAWAHLAASEAARRTRQTRPKATVNRTRATRPAQEKAMRQCSNAARQPTTSPPSPPSPPTAPLDDAGESCRSRLGAGGGRASMSAPRLPPGCRPMGSMAGKSRFLFLDSDALTEMYTTASAGRHQCKTARPSV